MENREAENGTEKQEQEKSPATRAARPIAANPRF
jgi:hypothetical protein